LVERGVEEENVAGSEVEYGGEVGEIADPVHPGGEKAGLFAESEFGPDVEAAFGRIAAREMDDGEGEGNIEEEPGGEPDDQGRGAVAGRSGDPAEADAGDDVEMTKSRKPMTREGASLGREEAVDKRRGPPEI